MCVFYGPQTVQHVYMYLCMSDVTVSIARRLQDPLAELIKIDPKNIGVGMYQVPVCCVSAPCNNNNNNNKNLCGRDGRTICGPQRVPKSTCVSL